MDKKFELIGALVGLTRTTNGTVSESDPLKELVKAAIAALYNDEDIHEFTEKIHERKNILAPQCAMCANPCGSNADYTFEEFRMLPAKIQKLKNELIKTVYEIIACGGGNSYEGISFVYRAIYLFGMSADEKSLQEAINQGKSFIKNER